MPRSAVIANLVHVLGFTIDEAEALLPEELPQPLSEIAATQIPTTPGPGPQQQTP